MKRIRAFAVLTAAMLFMLCACGKTEMEQNTGSQTGSTSEGADSMINTKDTGTAGIADNSETKETKTLENIAENFVLIPGGTFQMGSPETENWRSEDETQRDQNEQTRPELANHVEDMEEYDIIILGYPNWWASIPMPIASFLEEYDFTGKTIIPFCSHGGGRFGQSLTAISKLAPDAVMGEALSVHYSGGSGLPDDVEEWLRTNGMIE